MIVFALLLLFAGRPAQTVSDTARTSEIHIVDHLVSWGYRKSPEHRYIEAIIIHSSFNALTADSFSLEGVLREYKSNGVSPHFIINRGGTIFRLVRENDVAFQAGKSELPDGVTDVNNVSIGVELINTQKDSPTPAQYSSLAHLVRYLESMYPIRFVKGHSDIAPGRKTDPWNFDWKKFNHILKGN